MDGQSRYLITSAANMISAIFSLQNPLQVRSQAGRLVTTSTSAVATLFARIGALTRVTGRSACTALRRRARTPLLASGWQGLAECCVLRLRGSVDVEAIHDKCK